MQEFYQIIDYFQKKVNYISEFFIKNSKTYITKQGQ